MAGSGTPPGSVLEPQSPWTTDLDVPETAPWGTGGPVVDLDEDASGGTDRQQARELLLRFAATREPALRAALVHLHLPLVEYLARRFRNRGEQMEDLVQVGTIGLLKSLDRFDPNREVEFSTYATPTIVGELKRYFRDKGWVIRIPRRLQELRATLNRATGELSQELGRSPRLEEIAARTGLSEEEVMQGLSTGNAYQVVSLDAPVGEQDTRSIADRVGSEDAGLIALEDRAALGPLIANLPERERRILFLRFFRGMTQSQIADRLDISQMHVSRLLNRTLGVLRQGMIGEDVAS